MYIRVRTQLRCRERNRLKYHQQGDDAAVKENVATMMKGDVKGKLFVDCSTIHPDTTNMIARDIEAQSARFVACPGASAST